MVALFVHRLFWPSRFLVRLYFAWYELSSKSKPYSSKSGSLKTASEPLTHNRASFKIPKDSIVRCKELTIGYGCPFFTNVFAAITLMKSLASLSDLPFHKNNEEKIFSWDKIICVKHGFVFETNQIVYTRSITSLFFKIGKCYFPPYLR